VATTKQKKERSKKNLSPRNKVKACHNISTAMRTHTNIHFFYHHDKYNENETFLQENAVEITTLKEERRKNV
jgi:hypothetical protein